VCRATPLAGEFEKLGGALARFPLDDDVIGNVGKKKALAGFVPNRSFGPDEILGKFFLTATAEMVDT
jgi:hypothetical protein